MQLGDPDAPLLVSRMYSFGFGDEVKRDQALADKWIDKTPMTLGYSYRPFSNWIDDAYTRYTTKYVDTETALELHLRDLLSNGDEEALLEARFAFHTKFPFEIIYQVQQLYNHAHPNTYMHSHAHAYMHTSCALL